MKKPILILCTVWKPDYWEVDKTAPYHNLKENFEDLRPLKNLLPLPAIGAYIRQQTRDYSQNPPSFLIVKGLRFDKKGEPDIDVAFISRMRGITSQEFLRRCPKRELFFTIEASLLEKMLEDLRISPPEKWRGTAEISVIPGTWEDWLGEYFLKITEGISNDGFEDVVMDIFKALGFEEVKQLGHTRRGEHPDGYFITGGKGFIWDCKNTDNYFVSADDRRAMIQYIKDFKEQQNIGRVYFFFVAHSFASNIDISEIERETSAKGALVPNDILLYLLYKKLFLGYQFRVSNVERLIKSRVVTRNDVDTHFGSEL